MPLERMMALLFFGLLVVGVVFLLARSVTGMVYPIAGMVVSPPLLGFGIILFSGLAWWWPRRHWRALSQKYNLPLSIQDERLHIEGIAVWLIADRENDAGQSVFRLNDSGEFEPRGLFPRRFLIDTISSYGSLITVVGGSSMGGDLPPAPRMTVFRSYDDGKTWHSEKPRMLRKSTVAFRGSHMRAIGRANRLHYRH